MSDEMTEQAAPAEAGAAHGEGGAAAPSPKGIKAFLVPIIVIVVAAVAGYGLIWAKAKFGGSSAPAAEGKEAAKEGGAAEKSEAPAHGAAAHAAPAKAEAKAEAKSEGKGEGKGGGATVGRNKDLAIPLTSALLAYRPADPTKPGDADKIVTLDVKGEMQELAQASPIVRNIASTAGAKHIVVRLALMSSQENFLRTLNEKNLRLVDAAGETLSRFIIKDIDTPGFQTLLRRNLLGEFNSILGPGTLQDVLIVSLATD